MKKIVTEIYQFDETDIELLKKDFPINPCHTCGMTSDCCGCPNHTKYLAEKKKYEDQDILHIALNLKEYKRLKKEIDKLDAEMCKILESLPDELFDLGIIKQ